MTEIITVGRAAYLASDVDDHDTFVTWGRRDGAYGVAAGSGGDVELRISGGEISLTPDSAAELALALTAAAEVAR